MIGPNLLTFSLIQIPIDKLTYSVIYFRASEFHLPSIFSCMISNLMIYTWMMMVL
jgi:hypothetical protein